MYRIVLTCDGVLPSSGEEAARDITAHFATLGDQYFTAQCEWDGRELILRAESDSDEDGQLTADYFYKLVPAFARELAPTGGVSIESVEQVEDEGDSSGGTEAEGYEQLADATKLELKDGFRRRCLHISGLPTDTHTTLPDMMRERALRVYGPRSVETAPPPEKLDA